MDMAIEEMSELTKALLKERRNEAVHRDALIDNILEEIADVTIMLNQLHAIFATDKVAEKKYNKLLYDKLERLGKTVAAEQTQKSNK